MGAALALEARQAPPDHGAAGDQGRARVALGEPDRRRDRLDVVPIGVDHLPVGGAEARADVLRDRQVGGAVVGDAVVVPQEGELSQAQMAGQRDHLVGDAFLQAAVADQGIGAVIHQIGAEGRREPGLGHRHADGVGDALSERPGGRLDSEFGGDFRMAVGVGAELAEPPDLLHRQAFIAGEMEGRVEQHGAVAVREDEAVAVGPDRVGGVAAQMAGEQRHGDLGAAEGRAGMPVPSPLDGVEGEEADRVGHPGREHGIGRVGHGSGSGGANFRRAKAARAAPRRPGMDLGLCSDPPSRADPASAGAQSLQVRAGAFRGSRSRTRGRG